MIGSKQAQKPQASNDYDALDPESEFPDAKPKDKHDLQGLVKIVLAVCFPFFFLIHWNGFLSFTWYPVLETIGVQDMGMWQFIASFISASIIFAGLYLIA